MVLPNGVIVQSDRMHYPFTAGEIRGTFSKRGTRPMSNHRSVASLLAGVLAIGLLVGLSTSSHADQRQARLRVGTLTCIGQGTLGMILGSRERLNCTYAPASIAPPRSYYGTITRLGLDIGIRGQSVIIWAVFASSTQIPSDALVGEFVGVAADASLGLGAGAQVLVGGTRRSIVLQPLSVRGGVGVNIAAGVAGMRLIPR
jgi:hypothetical protein